MGLDFDRARPILTPVIEKKAGRPAIVISDHECDTHIFLVRDVLDVDRCADVLESVKSKVWHESASKTDATPTRSVARMTLEQGMLDQSLAGVFPGQIDDRTFVGLSYERIIVAHYNPGDFFARHTDAVYLREPGVRSMFSVLIYLNDNFQGGETSFPGLRRIVKPEAGCALVFGHRHEHIGLPIAQGVKYALHLFAMYRVAS
jgi:prolyl 4-hydroxylase